MSHKLVDAIANMMEEEALKLTQQMLDANEDPKQILGYAREAMEIVGKRYENGEYFLPELVLSGEMLNQISELVKPKLAHAPDVERFGKVIVGTVEGDIHDIGKNIVTFMLDVNGFDVQDLGIDVSPQKFVDAIKDFKPQVVALSGFLTLAYDSMKRTIDVISSAGLRQDVKIMIGGGQIDDKITEYTEADAYGKDAMAAVKLCRQWTGGN